MEAPYISDGPGLNQRAKQALRGEAPSGFAGGGGDASPGIWTAQMEKAVQWAQRSSLWPLTLGLACCAIEMMAMVASRYDIARFGAEVFRATPRQADLMIVSGRCSMKMAPVLKRLHDQMAEPKWVIAMGTCASCGGEFNNYAIVQGIDKFLPVDIFVPGCPPSPEALIFGIIKLQEKIEKGTPPAYLREAGSRTSHREAGSRTFNRGGSQ